ncbi:MULTISPECIES: hypothetical protein [unclassified Streptomyces]|uniref:hypothetical protein n=1 Tax=unclassified Streptomyces TaxID=2593676 RepID=UPI0008883F3C|nr:MULTISPECIES: hypothetical protein [unclassified Streptomyces]PBC72328.1 hypothetical protein BX261_7412 [Streptomyces sp. 2321.6]SDR62154.1 hypothetical protein SAMN05216511_7291 [Streptomyces sp. KS_16]SEE50656.1 hypothetical protein SAMN05428940_7340 [Streptomyces sp. 2133.1]SNC77832.1 hypothetical protein SAMN06272741_7248 [Streptomyces sp. 2114.4]
MTTLDRPAPVATEWQLSRYNLNQIDDQIDRDGIYAKGYWQTVDGNLQVVGLRIGTGETRQPRIVAKFGDTILRHPDGTYSVRTAAEQAALRFKEAQLAEQRHQYLDLDVDSAFTLPGCICACPPEPAA